MDKEFHKQELRCRQCDSIMEKGFTVGDKLGIFWADSPTYLHWGFFHEGREGVEALTEGFWRREDLYFPAFRCEKCKIVEFKYTRDTTKKSSPPPIVEGGISPIS
jgi:hypothetical protein